MQQTKLHWKQLVLWSALLFIYIACFLVLFYENKAPPIFPNFHKDIILIYIFFFFVILQNLKVYLRISWWAPGATFRSDPCRRSSLTGSPITRLPCTASTPTIPVKRFRASGASFLYFRCRIVATRPVFTYAISAFRTTYFPKSASIITRHSDTNSSFHCTVSRKANPAWHHLVWKFKCFVRTNNECKE